MRFSIIVLVLLLICSAVNAEITKREQIDMEDLLGLLDIRVAKYRIKLPTTEANRGYSLKYTVERYIGGKSDMQVIGDGYIGLGNGDLDIMIRYPSMHIQDFYISSGINEANLRIEDGGDYSGAVSWHIAEKLEFELNKKFIFGIKVQGYDGLTKVSKDLNSRAEDFLKLNLPMVIIFRGEVGETTK